MTSEVLDPLLALRAEETHGSRVSARRISEWTTQETTRNIGTEQRKTYSRKNVGENSQETSTFCVELYELSYTLLINLLWDYGKAHKESSSRKHNLVFLYCNPTEAFSCPVG